MEPYQELRWGNEPPLDNNNEKFHRSTGTEGSAGGDCRRSRSEADLLEKQNKPLALQAGTTALLIVDVQPEYWSDCPAVRKDFPEFPDNLERTIETSRRKGVSKIIFVRADYRYTHSPWLVQFSRIHRGKSPETNPTLTEIVCDPESKDFKWEPFATPEGPHDVVMPKSSWSSTSNTALVDFLRRSGIETVMVCGLITSVCVQHSAFGLFEAGFRTLLVKDACADRGRARHDAALALYGNYMYELITSSDLDDPKKGLLKSKPFWLSSSVSTNNIQGLISNSSSSSSISGTGSHYHHLYLHPPQQPKQQYHGPSVIYDHNSCQNNSIYYHHHSPLPPHHHQHYTNATTGGGGGGDGSGGARFIFPPNLRSGRNDIGYRVDNKSNSNKNSNSTISPPQSTMGSPYGSYGSNLSSLPTTMTEATLIPPPRSHNRHDDHFVGAERNVISLEHWHVEGL